MELTDLSDLGNVSLLKNGYQMAQHKINLKVLRKRIAEMEIFTFAELSRRIGYSRSSINHCNRLPTVRKKIKEFTGV